MSWRSFKTDGPPPHAARVLVTNNIKARDAHGQMSHVWIGFPIYSAREWIIFDDADRKVYGLSHWMPLPEGDSGG